MRVERTHSERFEAEISSRVILDQEIKEANSSSQSSLLSPLRPCLDGDRLATFLNQLDLYADAIKSGESAHRHLQELRVENVIPLSQLWQVDAPPMGAVDCWLRVQQQRFVCQSTHGTDPRGLRRF